MLGHDRKLPIAFNIRERELTGPQRCCPLISSATLQASVAWHLLGLAMSDAYLTWNDTIISTVVYRCRADDPVFLAIDTYRLAEIAVAHHVCEPGSARINSWLRSVISVSPKVGSPPC